MSGEAEEQTSGHEQLPEEASAAPKPGSIHIRPTRRDAEQRDDAFYELLKWSRIKENFSLKGLGALMSADDPPGEPSVSKTVKRRTISPAKQHEIINHIFNADSRFLNSARKRISKEPHALYFALLHYLQINETSQDNARAAIVGTFRFWRRSVEHPSEFLQGKLVFAEEKETRAVIATMHQAKRARDTGGPTDPGRATRSRADGYFFRVGKHYLMMLQDKANREFRLTYFPGVRFSEIGVGATDVDPNAARSVFAGRQRHIISLDGYVIGIDYNRCFLSPIYATLVDDADQLANLDNELDVLPADALPRRVLAKLEASGPLQILA